MARSTMPVAPVAAAAELADLVGGEPEVGRRAGRATARRGVCGRRSPGWAGMPGDERAADDGLARPRRRDQHPELVAGEGFDGRRLLGGSGSPRAGRSIGVGRGSLVGDHEAATGLGEIAAGVVAQAAGKQEPVEGLAVAADEPGCVPGREPQPLLLVELGVVERRRVLRAPRPARAAARSGRCQHRPRSGARSPPVAPARHRRRAARGSSFRARRRSPNAAARLVDRLGRQAGERREERPLVLVRLQGRRVEEHGRAPLAARALERKGDEVAERAFGQEVLRGEEAGRSWQDRARPVLSSPRGAGARRAAGRRTPAPVRQRTSTRAPPLPERERSSAAGTPPAGRRRDRPARRAPSRAAVEVAGQQLAGVSRKQGVQSDGRLARQVPSDDLIGQR